MDNSKGEWVLSSKGETKFQKYPEDKINWTVADEYIAEAGLLNFFHVTTVDLNNFQIEVKEGNKEFGPGFYTLGCDTQEPYKLIAAQWFQEKQSRFDWHVISFSLRREPVLKNLCNGQEDLKDEIAYYLMHSTGYPHGGDNPNDQDLANIDKINRTTRVCIFPHNKDTKVAFGSGTDTHSWLSFTAPKLGGGDYWVIIGPQQPDYMMQYRQYTWTTGWGIYCVNTGTRSYAYRNYTHNSDGSRKSIGGKWPSNHKVVIDERYKKI